MCCPTVCSVQRPMCYYDVTLHNVHGCHEITCSMSTQMRVVHELIGALSCCSSGTATVMAPRDSPRFFTFCPVCPAGNRNTL